MGQQQPHVYRCWEKRKINRFILTKVTPSLRLSITSDAVSWQQFEIDLTAKGIDTRDPHAHIVAQAEFFAVAAPFDHVFLIVIVIVVVNQRRKFDQTFDEIIVELDEKAEVSQAVDKTREFLADAILHELSFFEIDHLPFGIDGMALALGGVLSGVLALTPPD